MSLVGKGSQYYSGFTPQSIPGCALWLDATSGIVNNIWNDKSGRQNNLTQTSGTYTNTTINGNQAFLISNAVSGSYTNPAIMSGTTGTSVFMVISPISGGINHPIFTSGSGLNSHLNFADGGCYENIGFSTRMALGGIFPSGTLCIYANIANRSGNTILYRTGNQVFSGTYGSAYRDYNYSFQNWIGTMCEIIIFNFTVTLTQQQQIEGYLANKWGLVSNLPTSHPYRPRPPILRPFSPLDISECVLWLDAADRSSFLFSSGSNISVWNSKAPSSNSISSWDSTAMYTQSGTLGNGLPTVTFSNYAYTSNIFSYGGSSPETIIMVANNPSTSQYTGITRWTTSPPNTNPQAWSGSHVLNVRSERVRGEIQGVGGINYDITGRTKLAISVLTSNALNLFECGTSAAGNPLAVTPNQTNANLRIGTGGGVACDIGEIIIYNNALSSGLRQLVEAYLADKWGLRGNLPSTHPLKLYKALSVPFNPAQVTGCSLWFDAADTTTLTLSGSNVTQWNDKSGNGMNAIGVNNPTFSNNTINFLRTSNQYFTLPNGALPSGNSGYSYFVLCRFTNDSVKSGLIGGGSYGSVRSVFAFRNAGGEVSRALLTYWWGDDFTSTANVYSLNSNIIAESFYTPGVSLGRTMSVYGNQVASNTPGNVRLQTISNNTIGVTNNSEYMSGTISEIVVYSSGLTIAQRQVIEGYLAWKWGLNRNLPTTHPYYKFNPS